jgi:glycosyltransferase involved in cell wall biosynthesis
MLIDNLGFRPPSPGETTSAILKQAMRRTKTNNRFNLPAAILSTHPIISYSGSVPSAPLGLASLVGKHQDRVPAWFLISPTWSVETNREAKIKRRFAVLHRLRNRRHRLVFMCNTPEEAALLNELGEAAVFHNKTSSTSETIFKPLEGVAVEFDAIYNAQLAPWKRHELTLAIERCAFIFYRDLIGSSTQESEAVLFARHATHGLAHVFINPIDSNGMPIRLTASEVNRHLNRASVGLCLSETEGAMFASMEYLLAGLPIVTTPSRGGRHVYFDEEYCITAAPDPRSIAEAVTALKKRNIPRNYIRARTLKRVSQDRARFIDLVNAIFEEQGSMDRVSLPWPFKQPVLMEWRDSQDAVRRLISGRIDAFSNTAS